MSFDPGSLFLSLLISGLGLGLFLYGKKQSRLPQLAAGLLLMGLSYFVDGVAAAVGVVLTILAGLWWALRMGW